MTRSSRHTHRVVRWRWQQRWRWWWRMSTTWPRARAPGIFILRRAAATITTTIGNKEQWASDGEALCASTQHILIALRNGDNDNGNKDNKVKHTCYASNIDATTSPGNVKLRGAQATSSNIDDLVHKRTRLSSAMPKATWSNPGVWWYFWWVSSDSDEGNA